MVGIWNSASLFGFSEEHWVDDISKRFFPVMFLLFNIAYWLTVNNALIRQLEKPEENGFKQVAFDFEDTLTSGIWPSSVLQTRLETLKSMANKNGVINLEPWFHIKPVTLYNTVNVILKTGNVCFSIYAAFQISFIKNSFIAAIYSCRSESRKLAILSFAFNLNDSI